MSSSATRSAAPPRPSAPPRVFSTPPRTPPAAAAPASTRRSRTGSPWVARPSPGPTRGPRTLPPRAAVGAAFALVLSVAACGDAEPPALEVGGIAYDERELLGLSAERRLLLGHLTAFGVAVARDSADAVGAPLVERQRLERTAELLEAARGLDSLGVADDELRARYRSDPAWELTVRHLIVLSERYESDAQRAEARAKAARALEEVRAGADFPEVAARASEEPGAEGRQGLLEPGRRGAWVDEFWNAAAALEVGEVSEVVETQYGFHVLRLEGRDTVPFAEARSRVLLETARERGVVEEGGEPPVPLPDGAELAPPDPATLGAPGRPPAPPDADEAPVVARWEGGSLDLPQFRRHLAVLPAPEWEATASDPAALRRAVERAVRLRLARDSADARGLELPAAVQAELERSWSDRAFRWSRVLGVLPGMGTDAVRAAALEALGASGQEADLVRREIRNRGPLLELAVPVTLREPGGG